MILAVMDANGNNDGLLYEAPASPLLSTDTAHSTLSAHFPTFQPVVSNSPLEPFLLVHRRCQKAATTLAEICESQTDQPDMTPASQLTEALNKIEVVLAEIG
jgi:hypothetical protein